MILYLDCSSGISGDMLVAALLSLAGDSEGHTRTLDDVVRPALKAAGIDRRLVSVYDVQRGGVPALTFRVPEGPGFSTFDELIMAMYASSLDQRVADRVAALSQRMAAAEAEVHGAHLHLELDELGGLDTAVDLISAVTLVQHLAPERIAASPPALGGGIVHTAHGELDVPAPAVAVLLRGLPTAPLDATGRAGELTTPTGASLLAHYVQTYGPAPHGTVVASGVGAGTREVPDRPNVLRAFLIEPAPQEAAMQPDTRHSAGTAPDPGTVRLTATGIAGGVRREPGGEPPQPAAAADPPEPEEPEAEPVAAPEPTQPEPSEPEPSQPEPSEPDHLDDYRAAEERLAAPPAAAAAAEAAVPPKTQEASPMPAHDHGALDHVVLEANIDDMAPELLAHAADVLREAGALDVWMTPAFMKKGRPGVVLHVLAEEGERQNLADIMFAETTTFGVRVMPVGRLYASERRETVKLGGLEIRVRMSMVDGRPATVSPEFEDCRRAAERLRRPAKVVYEAAQAAARARFSGS